jgi:hypothetical protein
MRLLPLLAAALLAACASVPDASVAPLRRIDAATTDLAALRAAVDLPLALRPKQDTVTLVITLIGWTGRTTQTFPLEADPDATQRAERELAPPPGRHITAYRLPAAALAATEDFRRRAIAERRAPGITFGVGAEACRAGPLGAAPLPFTPYLFTPETAGFVALAHPADLRRLVRGDLLAVLPPCA